MENNNHAPLVVMDARDKNGNYIYFSVFLPIQEGFEIPSNVREVTILDIEAKQKYKIYVGKTCNMRSLFNGNEDYSRNYRINDELLNEGFESSRSPLCCTLDDDGVYVVFAKVNSKDIVVSNIEELKTKIYEISDEYNISNKNMLVKKVG